MKKLLALALVGFVAACSGPKRVSVAEMEGGGGAANTETKPEPKRKETRSSEARACIGAMKDRARVVYQRTQKAALTLEELGISKSELDGEYFSAEDYSMSGTPEAYVVKCRDVYDDEPKDLTVTANLIDGKSKFNR